MMLFMAGLVVALMCLWMSLRGRRSDARAPAALIAVVYVAPALLVAVSLFLARDDLRLRFSLLGVGFAASADDTLRVSIGGDRGSHDIWISAYDDGDEASTSDDARARRLRQGELSLRPGVDEDAGVWVATVTSNANGPGLLGVRRDGVLRPLDAVELEDGDQIRLDERLWTVALGGTLGPPAVFASTGASPGTSAALEGSSEGGQGTSSVSVELPRRYNDLPIVGAQMRIFRPPSPGAATYPLAWLQRQAGGVGTSGEFFFQLPTGELFVTTGAWVAPAADGSDAGQSFVIVRGGEPLVVDKSWQLAAGERLYALGRPRWDGKEFTAGGIRDLRSFRVVPRSAGDSQSLGAPSVAVDYDTPEVFALPWRDVVELSDAGEADTGEAASRRLHLSMGGWQLADRSLYFRHTSLPVALESLAILELPTLAGSLWGGDGGFSASTPRGQVEGSFGEPLWLGQRHLAAIQVDRIRPPLVLALLVLALALAKGVAARAAELTLFQTMAAATLEGLLALRLLLGFQAWALPPFAEEPYALALGAWAVLPWAFLIASLRPPNVEVSGRQPRKTWLPRILLLGVGASASLFFAWRVSGGGASSLVWLAILAGAAAILVLRWWRPGQVAMGQRLAGAYDRVSQRFEDPASRPLLWWSLLAFVPTLLRGVLFLLGFRESLQLGERVALSLIHVPLAIVLEAAYLLWLWRRIRHRGELEVRTLLPVLAFLLGTWLAPAVIVSDLGLALLNMPVFLLALTWTVYDARPLLASTSRRRAGVASLCLGLLLLLLVLPVGARLFVAAIPDSLASSLYSERNFLRLLDFARPGELESVARKTSEELAVMAAVLRSYTSTGLTGRGYLDTEVSPHVRSTALREHVPAVFVSSQWGWAGSLGLIAWWLVTLGAGVSALPSRLDDSLIDPEVREAAVGSALASLAALTLSFSSLYMILANYRLALFTGKNVYLLGLDSNADILESALLFLMIAAGGAAMRDRLP